MIARSILLLLLCGIAVPLNAQTQAPTPAATVFQNVRIFNGKAGQLSGPSNVLVRATYLAYLNVVGGLLGWILHRDADTYRYIPASIRNYPGAGGVARMFEDRGFVDVRCHACLGGLMTIHVARKPGQPA